MSNLSIEEANKIIAEFMGLQVYFGKRGRSSMIVTSAKLGRVNGSIVSKLYSESLDALVPVWEKAELFYSDQEFCNGVWTFCIDKLCAAHLSCNGLETAHSGEGETIQQAACIATAHAILELKDEK